MYKGVEIKYEKIMKNIREIKTKYYRGKKNTQDGFNKRIEGFLFSDSFSATATKFLLMFVATGSVAFVGATLPGLIKTIGFFCKGMRNHKRAKIEYSKKKISNSFAYLRKRQLIEILKEKNGKISVRLTNKGKKRLMEYSLDMLEIKKPEKWDGKWRVLTFDIPVHPKAYNSAREALRNKIKELGFYQIHKSVWVYPYECEDELLFIAEMFKVQQYIEIFTVDKMLHEKIMREKFPTLR